MRENPTSSSFCVDARIYPREFADFQGGERKLRVKMLMRENQTLPNFVVTRRLTRMVRSDGDLLSLDGFLCVHASSIL